MQTTEIRTENKKSKSPKVSIQYSGFNRAKGYVQHCSRETKDLPYFEYLQEIGKIWDLEVMDFSGCN